ncbi:phosphoribosylanthranilate isomerase [Skermanella sp. TT6]|uniref:N-(5'-phosphoribosyl)anthranilate isomerase n=1 Tax=Skermanella cutis TaxID=2775420 RepID=A0ABX7B8R0_9PROT|nr:phosphoribosylanthranilate isomerase [Skermanella sp. TT6]QQP90759.1 phosphoribosylanthranilate isomerase [Skermanella sp. TT6]
MTVQVKICGVSHPGAVTAAVQGGARYIGLVFYERSPRHVAPPLAAELARMVPTGVRTVGLFVDPTNEYLEHVVSQVPLDLIQLHGDETPERVAEIRAAFSMPVMKAIKVSSAADLDAAEAYAAVADRLLFDAKPPAKVAALPGGNGIAFDWTILTGRTWSKPWMLSGGLTADNVAEAIAVSGAASIDVSSGVEDRPGHKDPDLIRGFLKAAGR